MRQPRNLNAAINAAQAGSAVARNTLWNIFGTGLPVLLALVTFPVLIHGIGTERFGVLAVAWVVLGHFGLFDLAQDGLLQSSSLRLLSVSKGLLTL